MMLTLASKRRRVEVPCSVKKKIYQIKIDKLKLTLQERRQSIIKYHNIDMGESTFGDFLKASQKWLSLSVTRETSNTRPATGCCLHVVHRHVITSCRRQRQDADGEDLSPG